MTLADAHALAHVQLLLSGDEILRSIVNEKDVSVLKEAIHIQNQQANMNLDNGRYLNPTWCTLGLT